MVNDSKGQISLELVLLIGLVFVIVMAIAPYIGENIELNQVMSAARMGFINASNDIAYNGTGNAIQFKNMTFNNGTIKLTFYSKKELTQDNIDYIQSRTLNEISKMLNTNVTNGSVKGRYTYTLILNNVV
ncbi:hypothetical protein [Methanobacterium oryzae]|uniref:hypothetical protein n=1 Tax=Methanobacterium oryzae TaxID=69540 RepID=UPI003D21A95C